MEIGKVAPLVLRFPLPRVVPPSWKSTVPVALPGLTVAVKTTLSPKTGDTDEAARDVVEPVRPTASGADVLTSKCVSPV